MDAELSALLAEVRADADRYNERFGRPKLTLIKGGFVLLTFEGERDKKRNGLAAIQRNRLKLIHSRFTDEEIAILRYCDELFKGAKNE